MIVYGFGYHKEESVKRGDEFMNTDWLFGILDELIVD